MLNLQSSCWRIVRVSKTKVVVVNFCYMMKGMKSLLAESRGDTRRMRFCLMNLNTNLLKEFFMSRPELQLNKSTNSWLVHGTRVARGAGCC